MLALHLHRVASFARESSDCLGVAERLRQKELERHPLVELNVMCSDDHAHSSRPQHPLDAVLTGEHVAFAQGTALADRNGLRYHRSGEGLMRQATQRSRGEQTAQRSAPPTSADDRHRRKPEPDSLALLGNQALIQMFGARAQAQMRLGHSSDPDEAEADSVAEQATGTGAKAPCACGATCPKCQGLPSAQVIQRKPASPTAPATVDSIRTFDGGHALDGPARGQLEAQLGADLSDVRVHTGGVAARSATALGARAFTQGRDIAFAEGEYRPSSAEGQKLIAHEAVHVIQQRKSGPLVQRQKDDTKAHPQNGGSENLPDTAPRTITAETAKGYSDNDLDVYADTYRAALASADPASGVAENIRQSLRILQSEQLSRQKKLEVVANDVPRPPGLPTDGSYALQPAGQLPPEVEASLQEGVLTNITLPGVPDFASLFIDLDARQGFDLGQGPFDFTGGQTAFAEPSTAASVGPFAPAGAQSQSSSLFTPTAVTTPLASAGFGLNQAINYNLLRYGFNAAGADAIGLVGVGSWFTPGAYVPETISIWGHTAIYIRQGGQVTMVRGFSPQLLELIGNMKGVRYGSSTVPGAIGADASLFTLTGARAIEYPVSAELAARLAGKLPQPGPVAPNSFQYTAEPASWARLNKPCVGTNCLLWAANEAEAALGGPIGPASKGVSVAALGKTQILPSTASQGRFIQFTRNVAAGEEAIAPGLASGAPVASGMSRGLQALKWGGRAFFVIGLATIPAETALAKPGDRARTFTGATGGFLGGLAAGAAAGLVCGPGAPVCSVVLGLGFGILGALGGRAAAEVIFDAFSKKIEEVKQVLNFVVEKNSPGSLLAGGMMTPYVFKGGYAGLLQSPANVAPDMRYEYMERRRRAALKLLEDKQKQLNDLRTAMLGK
jgi:hypothetical protein